MAEGMGARGASSRRGLPAYRSAASAVRAALPVLDPPARITVREAAARRWIHAGASWEPWRDDAAPYMAEPMEMLTSRRFEGLVFVGPARSSKTEALVLNAVAHVALAAPRLLHIGHMGRLEAERFTEEALDPMIRNSPELAGRLAAGRSADTLHKKRFQGGGAVRVGWPVVEQLSGVTIPFVVFTDYDRQPQDLQGEGSPFSLGRKRTTSVGSRGMCALETSPGFEIEDRAWSPASPHEAPPCKGALALYNQGTRGRLYWQCLDCRGEFEPRWERFKIPEEGTPAERGRGTVMICPHCGSVISPALKSELNRGILEGRGGWRHETAGGEIAPLGDLTREAGIVSYWMTGAAAAFASWARVVSRVLEGEAIFEETGGEGELKAAINLDDGRPYLPRARGISAGLSEAVLRERATDHRWQVAPARTRFITIAVDPQVGWFAVQVEAWLEGLERVVIDRFDIAAPPPSAPRPEGRRIDPARVSEDWAAVEALADRSWPVANSAHRLRAVGIIVDSGGEDGVTGQAYAFWRRMRAAHPLLFHVARGRGGERWARAKRAYPEAASQGKLAAKDVEITWVGTDRLKDEIAASLMREMGGPRKLHVPASAPANVFAEFAAEQRGPKGWEKRPGQRRNESLDLAVYALGHVICIGGERLDWANPPTWAAEGAANARALMGEEGEPADAPAPSHRKSVKPRRRRRFRPGGGL